MVLMAASSAGRLNSKTGGPDQADKERKEEDLLSMGCKLEKGFRYRKVYLGSCNKLSHKAALQNAGTMKKEALGNGKERIKQHA
jgi:hypothetical protein